MPNSIELGDITVHNLRQLKKINQVVFPVSYNDKFYKDVLDLGPLAKLGKLNRMREREYSSFNRDYVSLF